MKSTKFIREVSLAATILLIVMFCGVSSVAAKGTAGTADKWQNEITIYGWLPSIDGDFKYSLPPEDGSGVSVDASDILDSLNFVFMGAYEGRYNKWSFGADIIYMDLSNSKNATINVGPDPGVPVGASVGLDLKSWLVTTVVGYDVVQTDKARMALIGGLRYLDLSADVSLSITIDGTEPPNLPPANLSGSENFWDGIIGVKGAFMLSEHWYIPYYADIGTGDSEMTWQLYGGIGYMFHWGDIKLGYRYLEYDMDDDKFVQDLKFSGPLLGIGFRF